jgi:hypothetical protein
MFFVPYILSEAGILSDDYKITVAHIIPTEISFPASASNSDTRKILSALFFSNHLSRTQSIA